MTAALSEPAVAPEASAKPSRNRVTDTAVSDATAAREINPITGRITADFTRRAR